MRKTQVAAQRTQCVADPGDDFALEWIAGRLGGGERRQVIGLTCEHNRNSAPRTRPVDPEELWERHASLRRIIVTAIERCGGRIVRSDLDVTVAYWGYPRAREGDARRAVSAALAITRSETTASGVRCAIEAGLVVVEDGMPSGSANAAMLGEVESSCHALAQVTPAGAVAISRTVRSLVAGTFELSPLPMPPHTPAAGVGAWIVEHAPARYQRMIAPISGELVGRVAEIETLENALAAAWAGDASTIEVRGPAGHRKIGGTGAPSPDRQDTRWPVHRVVRRFGRDDER